MDLLGQQVFGLIHPDDVPVAAAARSEILGHAGASDAVELRYRHADGRWHVLEVIGRRLCDGSALGGIVLNSRDVTERKQVEAALHDSETRFRSLYEQSLDAILVTRPGGPTLAANPAACRLFGRSKRPSVNSAVTRSSTPPRPACKPRSRSAPATANLPAS